MTKDPTNGENIVQWVEPVEVCHCVLLCIVTLLSIDPVTRSSVDCQASKECTVTHNAILVAKQSNCR